MDALTPLPAPARIAQARVMVVGDVMLDRYWYGAVDRISPEAPVPVVRVTREEERSGGGTGQQRSQHRQHANQRLAAPRACDVQHVASVAERASTKNQLAKPAFVIHIFAPFSTHSSPTRRAVVLRPATSLPAPGSVTA
jgi:hypothetical protein